MTDKILLEDQEGPLIWIETDSGIIQTVEDGLYQPRERKKDINPVIGNAICWVAFGMMAFGIALEFINAQ
jgi:hypothetical protein